MAHRMRPHAARTVLLVSIALAAACGAPEDETEAASRSSATAGVGVDAAIAAVNARIGAEALPVRPLRRDELLAWIKDFAPLALVPKARAILDDGLQTGVLAPPFALDIVKPPGFPPRIVLQPVNETIVEGDALRLRSEVAAARACTDDPRVCSETFAGTVPPATAARFPPTVDVRIAESRAVGTCLAPVSCRADLLTIELRLTHENLDDAVAYFAHGFDPGALRARAGAALRDTRDAWVRLETLLPGWAGQKASTYPVQGDNEVCHGPARQFFEPRLENRTWDRSTEATEVVLERHYCRVPDDGAPGFGDYLYIAGMHSGRFILADPATGRWIGFSVQSGGTSAYRFWWVDEDFSGKPFAHDPLPTFREELVDVWRRCR